MKKIIIWIIVVLGVIGGGWLISRRSGAPATDGETIKIGVILPLSGTAAYYGDVSKKGIELAKEEIEKTNPELKLFLVYEDSFYTPKGGVDAYQKLAVAGGVDAIITAASQVSLAVEPLAKKDNVLQMAIFSSADKYTQPDDLTFRVSTRNEVEASALADFLAGKGFKKLAILYLNNDFGLGFKEALKNNLAGSDLSIVADEGYLLEASDFRTQLAKIKSTGPDVLFIVGTANHYAKILNQAKELGLRVQFVSMRSAEDPVLIKNSPVSAEGLIYSYPFDAADTDQAVANFSSDFIDKYKTTPDAYAAEGYEGMKLIGAAFAECGKNYPCIANYLHGLKERPSVFGPLSFDQNGDVTYGFFLKTVKNGEFVKLDI